MGLLDSFFGNADQTQALGLFGAHLMAGNAPAGFQAASGLLADAPKRRLQEQMLQMQLEQQQMAMEKMRRDSATSQQMAEAAKSAYVTPEQARIRSGMMGPMPDGGDVPQVSPGFDANAFIGKAYGIDPMQAIQLQHTLAKDDSPIKLGAGESLYDRRTLKPLATAPKEHTLPAAIQEYQFAQNQGYKGTFEQWDRERKKAGANNVNLSVNTEKNLLGNVADGLGKSVVEARTGAQSALGTINTVNRLNEALDSNKVMAGPGTTFRQYGLQVGNMLGISGKDANEKLLNTRQAIQSLAQLELDGAQQMKGQGQITEAERAIIKRAASGDVDGMTTGELRLLGGILDRTARSKIRSYNSQVKPLMSNPNAAPIAPFLAVDEPSAPTPANVLRFDAQGNLVK